MDLVKTKTRSPAVAKIRPATRYVVVVDGKPGAYGMYVPDMPGCYSMGNTIAELLTNAQEALQLWAEDAIASKADLPEPRSIDEVRKDPAVARDLAEGGLLAAVPLVIEIGRPVKANLSLDAGLLTAIDEAAAARGLTRSAFIASAVREKIAAEG
jgi:predicted RNase H-like HicB family nuclease